MTQFALAVAKNVGGSLVPISRLSDDFLLEIAGKLFPNSSIEDVFVFDVEGKDIDCLMLDAQRLVAESSSYRETELYNAIVKLAPTVDELAFWYGSDYDDLDCVYDISALLGKLEEAVNESNCELYLRYKKVD